MRLRVSCARVAVLASATKYILYMKTMTCSQLGGPCDASMTAGSEKEMMDMGWAHMESAHPEMAKEMGALPQEDKDKWTADFHAKWEAQAEDAETMDEAPVVAEESAHEEPAA
jgi:predicted small metal-binding protein